MTATSIRSPGCEDNQAEVQAAKIEMLEAELQLMHLRLAEKDAELKARLDRNDLYHIVEPAVSVLQQGFAVTSDLPVLGRFVRLGVRVADVGVRRLTPWKNCAEISTRVTDIAPYLDEKVISPQIHTYREVVAALCRPTLEASVLALEPYRPYANRVQAAALPLWKAAEPYAMRIVAIARPIVYRGWKIARPWLIRARWEIEDEANKADKYVGETLDNLDAAVVYENLESAGEVVTEFAKAHAGEAADVLRKGAELIAQAASTEGFATTPAAGANPADEKFHSFPDEKFPSFPELILKFDTTGRASRGDSIDETTVLFHPS